MMLLSLSALTISCGPNVPCFGTKDGVPGSCYDSSDEPGTPNGKCRDTFPEPDCDEGLVCDNDKCLVCGHAGEACCSHPGGDWFCTDGVSGCDDGDPSVYPSCSSTCGSVGMPCCTNSICPTTGAVCGDGNLCVAEPLAGCSTGSTPFVFVLVDSNGCTQQEIPVIADTEADAETCASPALASSLGSHLGPANTLPQNVADVCINSFLNVSQTTHVSAMNDADFQTCAQSYCAATGDPGCTVDTSGPCAD